MKTKHNQKENEMTKEQRIKNYNDKKESKIIKYQNRAEKAQENSNNAYSRSSEIASQFPMGQPILVGHHSEKKHRRELEKSNNLMGKSIKESKKADYWEKRAAILENNKSISSDDPEAVEKLKNKIAELEAESKKMKDINAAYRYFVKKNDPTRLEKLGINNPEKLKKKMEAGYSWEKNPFPAYAMQNLRQNLSRYKKRLIEMELKEQEIEKIDKGEKHVERVVNDIRILENVIENRLQIFFPGKPSIEIRKELKSNGFRWSPKNGCWQLHLSDTAKWKVDQLINKIDSL